MDKMFQSDINRNKNIEMVKHKIIRFEHCYRQVEAVSQICDILFP